MKLADYLYENSMTPQQFRRMLGVKSRSTMWRWLINDRIPQPQMAKRIEALTGGKVRRDDFLNTTPPRCAKIVIDASGKTRWRLPWSPGYVTCKEPVQDRIRPFSPPVQRALCVLKKRVLLTSRGKFILDGRQADLHRIMRAANDDLRRRGQPPIPYPGIEPLE